MLPTDTIHNEIGAKVHVAYLSYAELMNLSLEQRFLSTEIAPTIQRGTPGNHHVQTPSGRGLWVHTYDYTTVVEELPDDECSFTAGITWVETDDGVYVPFRLTFTGFMPTEMPYVTALLIPSEIGSLQQHFQRFEGQTGVQFVAHSMESIITAELENLPQPAHYEYRYLTDGVWVGAEEFAVWGRANVTYVVAA